MTDLVYNRAKKKKLRVVFPDGTIICFKNATTTYIEAIKKIGPEVFASAGLEIGYLPVVSTECYERYKKYMMPLTDGWWVNTQSDSSQKYLQLRSVKTKLGLEYEVQLAEEFDEYNEAATQKSRKQDLICVYYGEDEFIHATHNEDVFVKTIERIGAERILYKSIEFLGKETVTRYNKYPKQRKLDCGLWVTIPNSSKDMRRALEYINEKLKIGLRVSSLSELTEKINELQKQSEE
jgi:hypothetical protein